MLQYVFLDIAYDILESTDWGITKASVSLSNNERFDTFTLIAVDYCVTLRGDSIARQECFRRRIH